MARPTLQIDGLKEAIATFRQLATVTQEAFTDAIRVTASEIVRVAQSRLTPGHGFQTGALQRALGFRVSPKTGQAWIGIRRGASGSAAPGRTPHRPTRVGHLIEFGHGGPHPARAYPFLKPAVAGEQSAFMARCRAAGPEIERNMAAVGARFR